MEKDKILVFGSGHLATRTKHLLKEKGFEIIEISNLNTTLKNGSLKSVKSKLEGIDTTNLKHVFIVENEDDENLEFFIAINSMDISCAVSMSIFNNKIASHLKKLNPRLKVFSPGEISAKAFVNGLDEINNHSIKYEPPEIIIDTEQHPLAKVVLKISFAFMVIVLLSSAFFHYHNKLSWIDSVYFVIVTMSTTGYGDINLLNEDTLSKVVDITLMIVSTIFIWFSFSLIIDEVLKNRELSLLGIKKYNLKGHIILCGLGRIGYFVAENLIERGEKVIIVEQNKDLSQINHFKSKGIDIYIGDASLPKTLTDVNVANAKALYSLISDDSKNLEVGLNARSIKPDLRLILRIYDKEISDEIKDVFDIQLTYSVSDITAREITQNIA